MAKHHLDANTVLREAWDPNAEALKMTPVNMEFALSLNAEEDSIATQTKMQIISCKADDVVDTSKAQRMCVTAPTEVKMVVLENEIFLGTLSPGMVVPVCSPAIKVTSDCILILQS